MPNKLLIIMIDGVSADYFASQRGRLPHLDALAARGLVVDNLHAEVLGTSLPGRVSMMTGVTADVSGIYGNMIWDGEQFRYANPDDVRVPTIPGRAKAAGLDVAVLGFGMIRPEDATFFKAPWWVSAFVQRARDVQPRPADMAWLRAYHHRNGDDRFERACQQAGFPSEWPDMDAASNGHLLGMIADLHALNWAGILAASHDAPDLIVTEYLTPDSVQHHTGYNSPLSHLAIAQADQLVGTVVERLRRAGVADQWNIAIMSDHGHSAVETAIHPQVIIPGTVMQGEGSILNVVPRDAAHLDEITQALAVYGVTPFHTDYVPADFRPQMASFLAPSGAAFELDTPGVTEPTAKPALPSSHGLRPGLPGDDRFCVIVGPDVPPGTLHEAAATQVAPTFARLLGLPLEDYPAAPIF